jgi:hypothetical protein
MSEQNSRLNYIKTPIELVACPFFTLKEKEVIAEIISLSDKYLTNGGCCRTNKSLAFRHRITPEKISNIITTANRLGFVIDREDIVHIKKSSVGKSTRYSTERKLIMRIPEEWVIMGDLYNGAFIREDEELYELFLEIETELKSIKRTELDQEIVSEIIKSRFTRGKSKNLEGLNKNPQANNKSKIENKSRKRLKDISPELDSDIISPETKQTNPPETKQKLPVSPERIMPLWNRMAATAGLSPIQKITPGRQKHLKARLESLPHIKDWRTLFSKIEESSFLTGDNDRGWLCTFDWIIKSEDNLTKVLEGSYNNKEPKKKRTRITNDIRFGTVYGPSDEVINNGIKSTEGEKP